MRINPINTINTTNFKANIVPTESLKETFDVLDTVYNIQDLENSILEGII